jgi:anti-anti-sigma factor
MAQTRLSFESEEIQGITVIHVSGPLDSATIEACREYLDPKFSRPRVRLVLDCQNLTYVNSRGLGLLMHYQRTAIIMDFSFFGVAALSLQTLKSLQLLGLEKFLTWYPTIGEALQAAAAM